MLRTKARPTIAFIACALAACSSADPSPKQELVISEQVGCSDDEGDAAEDDAAEDDAASDDDDGSSSGTKPDVPCDVAYIIATHCGECHGPTPKFGAPMALTKLSHFQGPAVSDDSRTAAEVALERVNETTPARRMPPASTEQLSDSDKEKLGAWLEGGAQGSTAGCSAPPDTGDDDDDDDGGGSDSGGGGGPTQSGSGGASTTPIEYDDPLLKCYEFRAFTQGNKSQPYNVPTIPDFYVAFNFNAPWEGTQYARSFRALIDNEKVIHHWLFFQQSLLGAETVTENALGAHPDGEMLAGWAPGGSDLYFHQDVAFELRGDVNYQLEAHFNNTEFAAEADASGVELCMTPTKPTHVAGLSWVGTDAIFGAEATGHCAPGTLEDIHLISGQPHMHTKGRHMKVVLERADGRQEVIHDEDFDFNYQRSYDMGLVINPGDQLWTTCTYSEFAVFGKGTNDEMCYFFSNYYPKGALTSLGVGTVIHGVNSCIDI